MNLLETPLTGPEAVSAFLSTLKPKNGSREIWLKLGHGHFFKAEWTEDGSFINATSTKVTETGKSESRVETYPVDDLLNHLLNESKFKDGGVFYIPTQPQGIPTAECVDSTDNIGLEMDDDNIDIQIKKYERFVRVTGLDFSSLLTSGGKSIHAHIKIDDHIPFDKATYLRRLVVIALKTDPVCDRAHQPMRFPGFYRKEKSQYQELLYYSKSRYSYDEIVTGVAKYFEAWGAPMPIRIPDAWWAECIWQPLKGTGKYKDTSLTERYEIVKQNLIFGVDNWERIKEAEKVIHLQKVEEQQRRREGVATIKGESIVDLVRKVCEEVESSIFEEADTDEDPNKRHNWEFNHAQDHARGRCLWHDSQSNNSAWLSGGDTWTYHCPVCTNDKPLDAFDYWKLKKTDSFDKHTGWEWIQYAKDFLRENGVEPPEYTVEQVKEAIGEGLEIPPAPELNLELDESKPRYEQMEEAVKVYLLQDRTSIKIEYENKIRSEFSLSEKQFIALCQDVDDFGREETKHISDTIFDTTSEIDERRKNPRLPGISTGLPSLDALTDGFKVGDYITIAAPSSTGKTTTMIQLSTQMADEFDYPTVLISAESPTKQLHYRQISYMTGIDLRRLRYGEITDAEFQAVLTATGELSDRNIYIDGTPGISISQIRQKIRRVAEARGGIGCVWVDNALSVAQPYPGNDNQSIAEISRQLSKMRREFNCTLVNLMQLNNNWIGRNEKRPINGDLYAGGSVTRDSDLILMLYRPDLYEENAPRGTTEFICTKARDGKLGTVVLGYEPSIMRFSEIGPIKVQQNVVSKSESSPAAKKIKKEEVQTDVSYF